MEESLNELYAYLKKCVGLQRQLLECVRSEHEYLIEVDIDKIQEMTYHKEALLDSIRTAERQRMKAVGELAVYWKRKADELNLSEIIIAVQGFNLEQSNSFRSVQNTISLLMNRVKQQNVINQELVSQSIQHIQSMKTNVLGVRGEKQKTYNSKGKSSEISPGSSAKTGVLNQEL